LKLEKAIKASSKSVLDYQKQHTHMANRIKSNPIIKFFKGKNQIHDSNREKATSIVHNIVMDTRAVEKSKYATFFDKDPDYVKSKQILPDQLMVTLGQFPVRIQEKYQTMGKKQTLSYIQVKKIIDSEKEKPFSKQSRKI
jgi:hypothetical protein